LSGLRSTAGQVLEGIPYAIRNVLLYFFLLFVLRALLRSHWAAAAAFAGSFALLDVAGNGDHRWIGALMTLLYFGSGAFAVLRWGLLSYAVGVFLSGLLMDLPATLDTSAWYLGNLAVPIVITVALASWAL
jgi:hypothetical protein